MALVTTKEMFEKSMKEGYAIGAFNVNNMEIIQGIVDAAAEQKSPVILQASSSAIKYAKINYLMKMVEAAVEEHPEIPIAIHLDHGPDFETCKMCVDNGFTSVMFDGSKYDFEENIRLTKEVVDYAHAHGVVVEAELGKVGGKEEEVVAESFYADKNECLKMVQEAKIDALAPALGSQHGFYKGEPKLGLKEMKEIHDLVKLPLVLHGGSGIPDDQIKQAINYGTVKININTDCLCAWVKIVHEIIKENPQEIDPRKIIGPGKKGIQDVIENRCQVFGSIGKANING